MSTTTLDPSDTAGVLASIRRIVGDGASPPIANDKRISVSMLALDSTQRAVADAAEHQRARKDATDRLEGMRDAAFEMRSARMGTAYRDQAHTGRLAPAPVSADPALSAMHLSRVASMAHSEAETTQEATLAAQRVQEATALHEAALKARKERFSTSFKRGAK